MFLKIKMADTAEAAQAPVTSDLYKTDADLPGRFIHPDWQKGYKYVESVSNLFICYMQAFVNTM